MRIRNKEHQSLGKKELQQLCQDFPNDQQLGEEVRKIASATTNNPKGLRATSLDYELKIEELEAWRDDNLASMLQNLKTSPE